MVLWEDILVLAIDDNFRSLVRSEGLPAMRETETVVIPGTERPLYVVGLPQPVQCGQQLPNSLVPQLSRGLDRAVT